MLVARIPVYKFTLELPRSALLGRVESAHVNSPAHVATCTRVFPRPAIIKFTAGQIINLFVIRSDLFVTGINIFVTKSLKTRSQLFVTRSDLFVTGINIFITKSLKTRSQLFVTRSDLFVTGINLLSLESNYLSLNHLDMKSVICHQNQPICHQKKHIYHWNQLICHSNS
ncbi:hypothetical protein Taro_021499 [Colocasia esculenta]|uniref:Uncharacterized protein n=1 Tax=Colocasia esculenta TaxID=4460 RepID=A0A843V2L2_COLES|nr:hypothetical protein [Colocasia esculenta]